MKTWGLLGQAETTKTEPAKGDPAKGGGEDPGPMGGLGGMMFPMVAIGLIFYFLILRPQQRQKAAHDDLLKQLKKNDRVATIGGIIGQVVSISSDEKEVVLKVDDNTRIRFRRSAIQTVINDSESSSEPSKLAT